MNSIGFISDLHLTEEQPERTALFLRFLEEYPPRLTQLYILGDLFDMWLGDDLIANAYQPIINALKQASNTLPINIIHGNRDFLMGTEFEKLSGCKILEEPVIVDLGGKPTLLMHGDLLCTDDLDYLQMRKQLRSPAWITSLLSKSPQERTTIAHDLRQKSQLAIQDKSNESMDARSDEVIKFMERHRVKLLIHGHTHQTAIHNHILSTGETAKRYVLDEWHNDHGQILIADEDHLHFETI